MSKEVIEAHEKRIGVSDSTRRERERWIETLREAIKSGLPKHVRTQAEQAIAGIEKSIRFGGTRFLRDRITDLEIENAALIAERDAQQWISVEDRLPDSGLCVLAYYTNSHGKGRRIRAEYVAPKSREVEWEYADPDTQCVEHDEESDSFYLTAGWYELIDNWEEYTSIAVVEGEVTHWMPLPAAPIALQGEQL